MTKQLQKALEEAARVCDSKHLTDGDNAADCAAAIRALKEKK